MANKAPFTVALGSASIISLAAATTLDLDSVDTNFVEVTGTGVSISSFGSGINTSKTVLWPSGVTLVHGASLQLRGQKDRVTSAGDIGLYHSISEGVWVELFFSPVAFDPADLVLGLVDAGSILWLSHGTAPSGWFECNGATLSRTTYSKLFGKIGTTYGAPSGTTFQVPDLRGYFIRAWDHSRGVDVGRSFASGQGGQIESHYHINTTPFYPGGFTPGDYSWAYYTGLDYSPAFITAPATSSYGGNETRPLNIALMPIIKY